MLKILQYIDHFKYYKKDLLNKYHNIITNDSVDTVWNNWHLQHYHKKCNNIKCECVGGEELILEVIQSCCVERLLEGV